METIEINGETYLKKSSSTNKHRFWEIGKCYFVRTVTMHGVGKLVDVQDGELLFSNYSWIADSGRFHDAMKTGEFSEIEPFVNDVIVNRNSVIDATLWLHKLPVDQK